ncbi:unnamed protein product [Closterium sp. NIES-53]
MNRFSLHLLCRFWYFQAIAGLNNFNADSVAAVVSAAEKVRNACPTRLSSLPFFNPSHPPLPPSSLSPSPPYPDVHRLFHIVEPEKFVEAVAAGAHMCNALGGFPPRSNLISSSPFDSTWQIEIGNFDSFYPDGREFTAEEVLDLTRRTRQLLPSIALSVTVPHTLPLPEQTYGMPSHPLTSHHPSLSRYTPLPLPARPAPTPCSSRSHSLLVPLPLPARPAPTPCSSRSHSPLVPLYSPRRSIQATPTIAATYSIARAVTIPVMCASGLSAVTVPLAFAAGASGVGVGSAINRLNEPIAMVAAVREIADAVNSQVTEKKAAASGSNN